MDWYKMPALPFTTIANIKNFSFVMTENDKTYKMHQLVRNIVYSDCDKDVASKINSYVKDYYYKILTDGFINISEYGNNKKYVTYSLKCDFKTEKQFVDFYRITFMPLNENLLKSINLMNLYIL